MNSDTKYMSLALRLAEKAEGMTSPNPLVGAVLVKKERVIGRGYHKKAGLPHAEIEALSDAERKGHKLKNSTLYVTLEPCCHTGKRTPPCVRTIIKKGVSNVVVGSLDLNPKVSGRGVKILREKGIKVKVGVLERRCKEINEAFFKYISTGTPFVFLKLAATLDGNIATRTGDSKWIGSEAQRRYAHRLRNKVDAVLVGIETVLHDDPQLTVRLGKSVNRQPTPVVLDSRLRIPPESRLLKIHDSPIVATTSLADSNKIEGLKGMGVRVLTMGADENRRVDISKLIKRLGEMGITSVLIEGGSDVAASAIKRGVVDKIVFFYAPKIIGAEGIGMVGKLGISKISEAFSVRKIRVKTVGEEFVVEGYPNTIKS